MTIKEMELATGMTRANIRFYESEGLICPERRENGYRVYTESDRQSLQKIRLLRSMDISLEDVKALHAGRTVLSEVLPRHMEQLEQRQAQLEKAGLLARELLAAGEEYQQLDPQRYLLLLEGDGRKLKEDVIPRLNLPWRRLFARDLDYMLCNALAVLLFYDFLYSRLVTVLAVFVMVLLLEPLMLSLFGTTPGKWIFGIRVTDSEEKRLSFGAGLERTWTVLWEGEALRLPLIHLYFLYKNYKIAEAGDPLPWEWDSELRFRDDKVWRCGVYALAYIGVVALQIWILLWKEGLL